MNAVLEVKHLNKKYKSFHLKDVSFLLNPGKICGFVGINGAGKSTTIKLIANVKKADSGEILLFGKKLTSDCFDRIGFVPDSLKMYGMYTVERAKKLISKLYKSWDEDAYKNYLLLFNLDEKKKLDDLSKGMKMQFSLAMALSHQAEILIMDEPTSGLDPYIRNQVLQVLKEFVSDGKKCVLFSTHITSDLEKVANQIVFIHSGKIIFDEEIRCLPGLCMDKFQKEWTSLDDFILTYIEYLSKRKGL